MKTTERMAEATHWFLELQRQALTPDKIDAWAKWDADPRNRFEFDKIAALWTATDRLIEADIPATTPGPVLPYDGSESIASWQARRQALVQPARRQPKRLAAMAIAASLLCAAVLIGLLVIDRSAIPRPQPHAAVFETAVAEHREITLQDGSIIHLGGKSSVSVSLSDDFRTVFLNSGEALFTVARDSRRPFNVIAGGGTITALGTEFNVRKSDNSQVVVTVTEGLVQVAPNTRELKPATAVRATRLQSGQQLTYGMDGGAVYPRKEVAEDFALAWRRGRLQYDAEPLRQVLADVNRYSKRPIVLADASAGELPYTGTVLEKDIDEWIAHLESIYPSLQVIVTDLQTVQIRTLPVARP